MSFQAFKLIYQAKNPINIGYHKLGFIQRTRYYITGRNMWGTITSNLARCLKYDAMKALPETDETPLERHYKNIGTNLVNKDIYVSYFYPSIVGEESLILLMPKFTNEGIIYGKYSIGEFERLFIRSFGETAIEPACNTAEEGSLHETEYIAPVIEEDNQQKQVYFVGYIFVKEGLKHEDQTIGFNEGIIKIKDVVREILVGGERKYGFGRLVLDDDKTKKINDKDSFMFDVGTRLILNDTEVRVEIEKDCPIPAHLDIETKVQMKGDIEPLVGREWGEVTGSDGKIIVGAGQKITDARICWVPGSIMEETRILEIGPYGIFE
jgi:hypothetical protein